MLIIVEGPDGAGKSTLVAKLREVIEQRYPGEKVEVLRKGPPFPGMHPLDEYELPLITYRPGQQHHVICDRWHWGEWVYPDVLRRKTKANRATWYHIEMFLQSRGATTVYVNEPVHVLERRIRERGDDLVRPEQLERLHHGYEVLVQATLNPTWTIIPHAGRIVEHARQVEARATRLNPYVTYVGPQYPQWVLVGDVRNRTYENDQRPAFMTYNATSGHYLLTHLRREHIAVGLGFINANDVDDVERFMSERSHHDVAYLALGQNSYDRLKVLGVHVGAPHPQYVRRFHHAFGDAYAEALYNAALDQRDMITWRP